MTQSTMTHWVFWSYGGLGILVSDWVFWSHDGLGIPVLWSYNGLSGASYIGDWASSGAHD